MSEHAKKAEQPEVVSGKSAPTATDNKELSGHDADEKPTCGLVMPISAMTECPASHWLEVKDILISTISGSGFACRMVSDDDGVGIIQDRIVKNIYDSDIVVCDVSHKNPNVMFELGMRLAFDKSVVIVKDDKTDYIFDTSPVEHLEYPRDLRYSMIIEFQKMLSGKLTSTYAASKAKGYSPFLKYFGQFNVAEIGKVDIKAIDLFEKMNDNLQSSLLRMNRILSGFEGSSFNQQRVDRNFSDERSDKRATFVCFLNDYVAKRGIKIKDIDSVDFYNSLPNYLKAEVDRDRFVSAIDDLK